MAFHPQEPVTGEGRQFVAVSGPKHEAVSCLAKCVISAMGLEQPCEDVQRMTAGDEGVLQACVHETIACLVS